MSKEKLSQITEAEKRIKKANSTAAVSLDLSNLGLDTLPDSISQLINLKYLYISGNQLTALPDSFEQLTNLQSLYIFDNQLTALPDSIGQLTSLQSLDISHNQLTVLPDSFGQLTQLGSLDLRDNQLEVLPENLRRLIRLERLLLHGNPKLGLPAEVLGFDPFTSDTKLIFYASPSAILDYYFRVRLAKRPLNEAKLILVGRGAAGKTSLVNRLLHNSFNQNEKKTDGIKISEWKLQLQGSEEVRLNLWDFGGQEIMHATHQFFLTQRSLYLLVLEGRQGAEDSDAEYWLKLIQGFGTESNGQTSPVLVVLNKINLLPFDVNRRALQRKYPFIRGFIKTDCADGSGISELAEAIKRETDNLEHLRDGFPESWFAIKDQLAGIKKSYITFDQYRDLCYKYGEKDVQAQESLAGHLHNLGIALNYREDPRLSDTHILNPEWVTNGIYTLLNSKLLASQKGEIHLADAANILPASFYPKSMHRFLFELMKKFELCFTFPDDDTHYLIPDLLDKQEPPATGEFLTEDCLHFEYRYPVLPQGLLPRFIVRTHALSTGLPRWRTGVVLAFEGNRALVKADMQDKRVSVCVTGPLASRRRLLAVIRSDLEHIHANYNNLNPEAWIQASRNPGIFISYADLITFESKGKPTYSVAVAGDVVEFDVQELLNGVDLEGERKMRRPVERNSGAAKKLNLFYSYSHKDEPLRNELETHLKILERRGLINPWHDRMIEAGEEWKKQIDENLESADIILLLVSAHFIASDYCWEKEMRRALERHKAGEARVIPVILRDVNWKAAPFAELQALPKDGKPVTKWPDKDTAWRNVSEGIEKAVKEMQKKP
jgi:internalin A